MHNEERVQNQEEIANSNTANLNTKILIVEDDLCLKTIINRIMKSYDQDVQLEWATTADEARSKLRAAYTKGQKTYDLVLSDIFMPGDRSGFEVWDLSQALYPDTPFVFMSGMPSDDFVQMMEKASGFPLFLPKPFRVEDCQGLLYPLLDYTRSLPR